MSSPGLCGIDLVEIGFVVDGVGSGGRGVFGPVFEFDIDGLGPFPGR